MMPATYVRHSSAHHRHHQQHGLAGLHAGAAPVVEQLVGADRQLGVGKLAWLPVVAGQH
ncbi:MAG: hypothetical protein WKG07_25695 [Hymenobacter sp.]